MSTIWQTGVGIVNDPSFKEAADFAQQLSTSRFRGCCIKLTHGSERVNEEWMDIHRTVKFLTDAKIKVGGWHFALADPRDEANLFAEQLTKYKMSFAVVDAEGAHDGNWPGGNPDRSKTFVDAYRAKKPKLPSALTTFGGAPAPWVLGHVRDDEKGTPYYNMGPMRFAPWWKNNFRFLPQAYPQIEGALHYEPVECVKHAIRAGWPLSWVHLMFGIYAEKWSDGSIHGMSGDAYIARYKAARRLGVGKGFQTFLSETMLDKDYLALVKILDVNGLAF